MHHYQLKIAEILWDIRSPIQLSLDNKCEPFLSEEPNYDIQLSFQLGKPEIRGSLLWEKYPLVYQDETGFWVQRILTGRTRPSGCVYLRNGYHNRVAGWIYPEKQEEICALEHIMDVSELEILLSFFDTVSLHSSLIRMGGKAILFTAPSGTGKSTQADLWESCRGAEILNGDRSLIRNVGETWIAYGSPFAGSSNIYRNESAPIRTIVVLRQAKYNRVRQLNEAEAFRLLYSEMVVPKWHREAHQKIISQTELLAKQVSVLLLQCTPDENAVAVLERFLHDQGI